jgi:glycosyltransferase involved in cell wall biosynthesis
MSSSATVRIHGEIESPRPLRAVAGAVNLEGWCLVEDHAAPPPVRLVAATGTLPLTRRTRRTDVPRLFPAQPAAADCGFVIEGLLPVGVQFVRFEAQLPDGGWRTFKQLTLAVEPAPFTAVLDEPISTGMLRDRVRVGGWALDPAAPVSLLFLRYGHREITCQTGRARRDVPALYPDVAHAAGAGFESNDFLVAGHGPVRARAVLADGRTVVARTKVAFSIAHDEFHGPEIDLTAPRVPLPGYARQARTVPALRTDRPLNVLFVLPGSFASNSALHVAALANELAAAGHACAVAVPHDVETISHHEDPAFRGVTHAEADRGAVFPDGRGPQLVHAWTTRENVRELADRLRQRHAARLVVHLEDNEQQLLALALRRDFAALEKLSGAELDGLVPGDRSHPHRSRAFLAGADGVTVITDRLRDFVPAGRPCHVIRPAADARYFYPRPRPDDFRRMLHLADDATVLFYHGNVHEANAAEVRELYAAVLALNREGEPVILVRTGLDAVDFLGPLASAVAPFVLNLGHILHHRYLPPLMALADIFVQPGAPDAFNDYRFPSKLPEFFALGRPVVLPRTNLGEMVHHGLDAYVLARADAAGIATAVRELRRDHALSQRLSEGAAAFAAKHFSWRRSAESLAGFYGTLTPP